MKPVLTPKTVKEIVELILQSSIPKLLESKESKDCPKTG